VTVRRNDCCCQIKREGTVCVAIGPSPKRTAPHANPLFPQALPCQKARRNNRIDSPPYIGTSLTSPFWNWPTSPLLNRVAKWNERSGEMSAKSEPARKPPKKKNEPTALS
jgi:hypothetical protein